MYSRVSSVTARSISICCCSTLIVSEIDWRSSKAAVLPMAAPRHPKKAAMTVASPISSASTHCWAVRLRSGLSPSDSVGPWTLGEERRHLDGNGYRLRDPHALWDLPRFGRPR